LPGGEHSEGDIETEGTIRSAGVNVGQVKGTDRRGTDDLIRVVVVDDHRLMNEALALVLSKTPALEMVGAATRGAEAVGLVRRTQPDVVLLDVNLPDGDALSLVPGLRAARPGLQILVLTSLADEATWRRAMAAGVDGFISKQNPVAAVVEAIRHAAHGEVVVPAPILRGLRAGAQASRGQAAAGGGMALERLTARELEVLNLIAEGQSSEQAAQRLGVSAATVKTHLRNVSAKLRAHSRLEAVAIALRRGLIAPPA
jgi:DNA-binding NarL/FixJ family response regulator